MSAENVVQEADWDESGDIKIDEFRVVCRRLRVPLSPEQVQEAFKAIDAKDKGACTAEEIREAMEASMKREQMRLFAKIGPADAVSGRRRRRRRAGNVFSFDASSFDPKADGSQADNVSNDDVWEDDTPCDTRLVALIAHNNMKLSLVAFVAKHHEFFRRVQIITTKSTGTALEQQLGLKVARKVASGPLGGDAEIGALITTDALAGSFFFVDPLSVHPHESDIRGLMRLHEVHNCPCATTPIMGEALVHSFMTNPLHQSVLLKGRQQEESHAVKSYNTQQTTLLRGMSELSEGTSGVGEPESPK